MSDKLQAAQQAVDALRDMGASKLIWGPIEELLRELENGVVMYGPNIVPGYDNLYSTIREAKDFNRAILVGIEPIDFISEEEALEIRKANRRIIEENEG